MKKAFIISVLLFVCGISLSSPFVFNSGGNQYMDYMTWDHVEVRNSTTLNVTNGGQTGSRYIHNGIRTILVAYEIRIFDNSIINVYDVQDPVFPDYYPLDTIIDGGIIGYNNSFVNISHGDIGEVKLRDSSKGILTDGSLSHLHLSKKGDLLTYDDSHFTVSGGNIDGQIMARGNSSVDIYGGTIGSRIFAEGDATIVIYGTNFKVDNTPVDYGIYNSTSFPVSSNHLYNGKITGLLQNGDSIDNFFKIENNATIVLVPEPATVSLLAVGGLALLRKRK